MSLEKVHSHLNAHVHHRLSFLAVAAALALVLNLVNAEVRALAQDQTPSGNVAAPAVQPDLSKPMPAPMPEKSPTSGGEHPGGPSGSADEEGGPQDVVDPREILGALQQCKQLRNEIRGLTRQLTQLKDVPNRADDLGKLKDLDDRVVTLCTNIKNPPADSSQRESLQEFYDARIWDEVQLWRAKIQLPKDLKDMARALSKIEKLLKLKSTAKIGLDITKLMQLLEQIKAAYNEANKAYQAGDIETAQETLQELYQSGMHPGGFEGAIYRMKGLKDLLRGIRDKQILAAVEDLLAPVYEALYEGDFQEVHNVLNEYEDDLRRLVNLIVRSRLGFGKVESRISDLEELIHQKSEALNAEQQKSAPAESPATPQPAPTQ